MKNKLSPGWVGVILAWLVQLACNMGNLPAQYQCEMEGGVWHPPVLEEGAWCEENPGSESESSSEPAIESAAALPTPASAQECNATLYIQTQVEITKNAQEPSYRECDYRLKGSNAHASEGIWIVRRTTTSTHAPPKDCDTCDWYSDLLFPGQEWEKTFRATFYSDGQAGFEYVDKVTGVFNRPECLYLLNSPEVEAISQPVEWACGP